MSMFVESIEKTQHALNLWDTIASTYVFCGPAPSTDRSCIPLNRSPSFSANVAVKGLGLVSRKSCLFGSSLKGRYWMFMPLQTFSSSDRKWRGKASSTDPRGSKMKFRNEYTVTCPFLTRTRSAEPAAPTPFKKFRHRELAMQKAETAIAGMAGRTTIPPPFPAACLDRPVPTLLPSEAVVLIVEIEALPAETAEEAFSLSPRFSLLPPAFRASRASATTALGKAAQ